MSLPRHHSGAGESHDQSQHVPMVTSMVAK